jgi:hypothetical protein
MKSVRTVTCPPTQKYKPIRKDESESPRVSRVRSIQHHHSPQNLSECSRVAPHQPGIVGLQQVGRSGQIRLPRFEPYVVAVWIEDHSHAVMNYRPPCRSLSRPT